jgi:hypothetical protein
METPEVTVIRGIWALVMIYWLVSCVVWQWRNPTANPMTCLNRIDHVVCFDKMPEFQVQEVVIGK